MNVHPPQSSPSLGREALRSRGAAGRCSGYWGEAPTNTERCQKKKPKPWLQEELSARLPPPLGGVRVLQRLPKLLGGKLAPGITCQN